MGTLLRLFIRDRRAYIDLRESKMIGVIPCPLTLIKYKNRVMQKTGIHEEFLQWMADKADSLVVPKSGRVGRLIRDEMSVQVGSHHAITYTISRVYCMAHT